MKKCCFIIPYYGRLPAQLPVFLKSCEANPDFNWLLFTDDHTPYAYPANVRVVYNTFSDIARRADEKFGFHVCLDNPYKLCDLKPAYGFLFEEYLEDFRFWGHCDLDTVMGNLGKFLTDTLLGQHDKLFCMGHMTLFRNSWKNNRVFMRPHNGRLLFKDVLTHPDIRWYDEEYHDVNNNNQLFLSQGKRVYQKDLSLNIYIGSRRFRRTEYVGREILPESRGYRTESYRPALYYWDRGDLFRLTLRDGRLEREEFLYAHLQYRSMEYDPAVLESEIFQLMPNRFAAVSRIPDTALAFHLAPKFDLRPRKFLRAAMLRLPLPKARAEAEKRGKDSRES